MAKEYSRAYVGGKMAQQQRDDKYAASKFGGQKIPNDRVKAAMDKLKAAQGKVQEAEGRSGEA
jgi:hypothetical protein